ncbi:nucleotidyltransferase domain-containing protein [Peribacillus simplex]|uniref:nucleotidyltransferase domain-containing protein n=1 Tax=Peribacillus simplex TaxID=1478 RepID=UPI0024C15034|nr:nucleotidyltransferase family protein [Peribacillus simplex]WHY55216.1 nucleotidyltransferase family protein [Peribacillus simplex]
MDYNYNLNLSSLPKELRLLLEIVKAENDDGISTSLKELLVGIDWELFLELARHHRVYPLIYSRLSKLEEKIIPDNIFEILFQEYKKNTFQMLKLSGEMERLGKFFSEKQIRLLFLKGPAIAADIYGDISLRTSKDLDILIPLTDLKRAEELLLNFGYIKKEEFPAIFNEWQWLNHHKTYFHPLMGIEIEIHWRLHPYPSKEPSFNELWERKRTSILTSTPIYFLGKQDLFLFLVVHGARHGWFRLRWLVDIDLIIRKGFISEKNNMYQPSHIIGQALILTSQLLKSPINGEMYSLTVGKRSRNLAKLTIRYIIEMGKLHINKSTEVPGEKYRYSPISTLIYFKNSIFFDRVLFSMMGTLQKCFFIIRFLYPKPIDAMTLRLPKPLHLLYFPLRPFLWVWRKSRKPI